MTFEQYLIAFLRSNTALTGLITDRLYPSVAPDNTAKPYITYLIVAVGSEYAHDGSAFTEWTVQFSVFADKYSQATAIRDVLMTALSGYSGLLGTQPQSPKVVSLHSATRQIFEADTRLHHFAIDFSITA